MSSYCLFSPANSPKPKYSSWTIINEKEKQKKADIFTWKKWLKPIIDYRNIWQLIFFLLTTCNLVSSIYNEFNNWFMLDSALPLVKAQYIKNANQFCFLNLNLTGLHKYQLNCFLPYFSYDPLAPQFSFLLLKCYVSCGCMSRWGRCFIVSLQAKDSF